jgi:phage terminase small subunit
MSEDDLWEEGLTKRKGLTVKREAFARAYVECGNAVQAYKRSFKCDGFQPSKINSRAHGLLKEESVAAKIQELRDEAAKRNDITVDNLTQMLLEDRKLARELGQPSAAINAVRELGKLHGLMVDKVALSVDKKIADMSDDELESFIVAEATKMGLKREA